MKELLSNKRTIKMNSLIGFSVAFQTASKHEKRMFKSYRKRVYNEKMVLSFICLTKTPLKKKERKENTILSTERIRS